MLTRRTFVGSALALPALAGGAEPKVPVVDTHLHCFAGANDPKFPYHKDAPYKPADAALPEHLLKCMTGAGFDFAVVVHPEPYHYGRGKCTSPDVLQVDLLTEVKRL